MPDQSTDYRIVVFGSAGVGKTNCVLRFVNGQFRENYIPTVEDTYRQVVSCNKQITTLQITDTYDWMKDLLLLFFSFINMNQFVGLVHINFLLCNG
jgi:nucleoside-triphosphatase THEP1